MNRLITTTSLIVLLVTAWAGAAENDSLFPKLDEVEQEQKPSLESAISQFEDIIKDSGTGTVEVLNSNDAYNKDRVKQLQAQLKAKQAYLDGLPSTISERFEALMRQHPDADQKTKNRMAEELHTKWKGKEEQTRREIAQLQEQLDTAQGRLSESAVKRQMIDISNALSASDQALLDSTRPQGKDPQAASDVFRSMLGLSQKRTLSQVSEFCALRVKPMQSELSLFYLDN